MVLADEEVYQEALHRGIVDFYLDGKLIWSFFQEDDVPFAERSMNKRIDGAEMTLDHTRGSLPFGGLTGKPSEFKKMPFDTFGEFLKKADSFYYEVLHASPIRVLPTGQRGVPRQDSANP